MPISLSSSARCSPGWIAFIFPRVSGSPLSPRSMAHSPRLTTQSSIYAIHHAYLDQSYRTFVLFCSISYIVIRVPGPAQEVRVCGQSILYHLEHSWKLLLII